MAPRWLDISFAAGVNRTVVAQTGEPHGILNGGALASALARPRQHHDYQGVTDIPMLAGLYMVAITQAHAFQQGNKRTGFVCGLAFATLNGGNIDLDDADDAFTDLLVGVITHTETLEALAAYLGARYRTVA